MKVINFGLFSLVAGIAQVIVEYNFLRSSLGTNESLLPVIAILFFVGIALAIASFIRERKDKVSFVMAIIGLALSGSPVIILLIGLVFGYFRHTGSGLYD